jgi:ribosomal protein S18 acetylase RimI-like enzyme
MTIKIGLLEDHHDCAAFESGVDNLDRYLKARASYDIRKRVASCWVMTDGSDQAIAFYSLTTKMIVLSDLPPELAQQHPRFPTVPATVLGRLAVDHRFRGRGLGELMLIDAFARTLGCDIATYALIAEANNETAGSFYRAYHFQPLRRTERQLFISMTEVAKLFM